MRPIEQVDAETDGGAGLLHGQLRASDTFRARRSTTTELGGRGIVGLRANASTKSHAELDEADRPRRGRPRRISAPGTPRCGTGCRQSTVLGGCCGTDARHVAAIVCGLERRIGCTAWQRLTRSKTGRSPTVAAAVVGPSGILAQHGDIRHRFELASVTKPLVARAAQVAVEEGVVELDTEAGPPGSTVRHLLAHASGYSMHSADLMAEPGKRRVYSNYGFGVLAEDDPAGVGHRVRAVPDRGGLRAARHVGHRAGGRGRGGRVRRRRRPSPTWSPSPATCCGRRRSRSRCTPRPPKCSFRVCRGCCPDSGRSGPTTGGWASRSGTASRRTGRVRPTRARTYGHFGQSGTFLWVDPAAELALVALTDRNFGDWAYSRWPALSDGVLREFEAD